MTISDLKNYFFTIFWLNIFMIFNLTQFWMDSRPWNTHFLNFYVVPNFLAPLDSLSLYPHWFETDLGNYSLSAVVQEETEAEHYC